MPFDTSRLVFAYTVGGRQRWADPAAVRHGLVRASLGGFDAICRDFEDKSPEPEAVLKRAEAGERLAACARSAFGLPPFDAASGEGATDAEALGLLDRFCAWLEGPPAAAG